MRLGIASVQYGDKDFFAADVFSDELSVHLNLFTDLSGTYRNLVTDEIQNCDKIASYIGLLANDLFIAAGGDPQKKTPPSGTAKEQYYYEIDVPFRRWLSTLDAEDSETERNQKIAAWRTEAKSAALRLAQKMVDDAGPAAFVGKTVKPDKNKEGRYYSSSLAMQWFKINMKKVWG